MMNKFKFLLFALIVSFIAVSCDKDDDDPEAVNEEEVITDVTLTFTDAEGTATTYTYTDPSYRSDDYVAPEIELTSGETYTVSANFYNNSGDESEVITEEITEEKDDHFLEFAFSDTNVTLSRSDADVIDSNGIHIGLVTSWVAGEASTGSVTVTLIHEPTSKDDTTDPNGSHTGGSTDAQVSFDLTIN